MLWCNGTRRATMARATVESTPLTIVDFLNFQLPFVLLHRCLVSARFHAYQLKLRSIVLWSKPPMIKR